MYRCFISSVGNDGKLHSLSYCLLLIIWVIYKYDEHNVNSNYVLLKTFLLRGTWWVTLSSLYPLSRWTSHYVKRRGNIVNSNSFYMHRWPSKEQHTESHYWKVCWRSSCREHFVIQLYIFFLFSCGILKCYWFQAPIPASKRWTMIVFFFPYGDPLNWCNYIEGDARFREIWADSLPDASVVRIPIGRQIRSKSKAARHPPWYVWPQTVMLLL